MVIIKRILIGIVALLVLFFVVGFLLPRDVRVERSVDIDASPQAVFTMVNDFQQFNRWQPWAQIDPRDPLRNTKGPPPAPDRA